MRAPFGSVWERGLLGGLEFKINTGSAVLVTADAEIGRFGECALSCQVGPFMILGLSGGVGVGHGDCVAVAVVGNGQVGCPLHAVAAIVNNGIRCELQSVAGARIGERVTSSRRGGRAGRVAIT